MYWHFFVFRIDIILCENDAGSHFFLRTPAFLGTVVVLAFFIAKIAVWHLDKYFSERWKHE